MKKRLISLLLTVCTVLCLAAPASVAEGGTAEQFDLEAGQTFWFDLSGMDIPGKVSDRIPDQTLHYVPFTYVGTISAYQLGQEMVATPSNTMEYEHSSFICEHNITQEVSWNSLNDRNLVFWGNLVELGGTQYYLHVPSGGSSADGGPFNNEWTRIVEKNTGYIKNCDIWAGISMRKSWCQESGRYFDVRAVRDGANYFSLHETSSTDVLTGYRPMLDIACAYGVTYPRDYLKAITLKLGGGSLGGSTDDIRIVAKTVDMIYPSSEPMTFKAPTDKGLTRPESSLPGYFTWIGDDGKLYAPGADVPVTVSTLTALWSEHTHCICGSSSDIGDHVRHDTVKWEPWSSETSLPTAAGSYYLINDVTLSDAWRPDADINLCLSGRTVTQTAEYSVAEVGGGRTFTLTDCTGSGALTGGKGSDDICPGEYDSGGGVSVCSGGVFYMYGGNIRNCSGELGGGVFNYDSSFAMYGGRIENCSTWGDGGAVFDMGEFSMFGGYIGGCTVTNEYAETGDVTLYGGKMKALGGSIDGDVLVGASGDLATSTSGTEISGTVAVSYVGTVNGIKYPAADQLNLTESGKLLLWYNIDFGGRLLTSDDSIFRYDAATDKGTLELSGVDLSAKGDYCVITSPEFSTLELVITGENKLVADNIAVYANHLIFSGSGSINIISHGKGNRYSPTAIECSGLTVNGGDIRVESGDNAVMSHSSAQSDGTVRVNDGSLTLISNEPDSSYVALSSTSDPMIAIAADRELLTSVNVDGTGAAVTQTSDLASINAAKYLRVEERWHDHCVCAGKDTESGHAHSDVRWQQWRATDSLPTEAGNYYLVNDVLLKSEQVLRSDVNLCLNGKTVSFADDASLQWSSSLISMDPDATSPITFTLTDCVGSGVIDGSTMTQHGATWNRVADVGGENKFVMRGSSAIKGEPMFGQKAELHMLDDSSAKGDSGLLAYGDAAVIMSGNASVAALYLYGNSNARIGGSAKAGTIFVKEDSALNMTDKAETDELIWDRFYLESTITLSGNAKVNNYAQINIENPVGGKLTMNDKAEICGDLVLGELSALDKIKLILSGDHVHTGGLRISSHWAEWGLLEIESETQVSVSGPINVPSVTMLGSFVCSDEISDGIFYGEVENNGRITGGIFYGTVTGTGTVEDSAKVPVTFDSAGGSSIAEQKILRGQKLSKPATPTRSGYDFLAWHTGGAAYDFGKPILDALTLTAQWRDSEAPTGEITLGKNRWRSFLNTITFGLFFGDTESVSITAADNSGEAVKIEYLLSSSALTEQELAGMSFTEYTGTFNLDPDGEYVIYARLTDSSDNVRYISSDGVVFDATSPVIYGIENGRTYCGPQTVTVVDPHIDTVTVNGRPVTLDAGGSFLLTPAEGAQTVEATDKTDNSMAITVTVNDGHTWGAWSSDGSAHTRSCTVDGCNATDGASCSGGTATCRAAAVCDICGESYGSTDPDNHTDTTEWIQTATEHTQRYRCCDKVTVETEAHEWSGGICSECGYGCTHIGGTATCHTKAVCTTCGNAYGELDGINHDGGTELRGEKASSCTADGYTGDTYCLGCGALLTQGNNIAATGHNGGTATCTAKAVCDTCGESYGATDPDNHSALRRIPAKEATAETEGNIEYWYCDGCKRCFSDETAKNEITAASAVIPRLPATTEKPAEPAQTTAEPKPNDQTKAPQTGEKAGASLLVLAALGSAAAIGIFIHERKHRRWGG